MPDYTLTKIYKIESHSGDKIYIGSTAKQYLSQRFQQHKSSYKSWKEGKGSKITSYELFDEFGPENCHIVLIEEYSCNSKDAKNAREGHCIRTLDCVNKCVIGRTPKESQSAYCQSEKGKERTKRYHQSEKGKEALKEAQKKYYQRIRDGELEQENISEPITN